MRTQEGSFFGGGVQWAICGVPIKMWPLTMMGTIDIDVISNSKIIFKCFTFVFQSEDDNDGFIPASM